ncbi:MAG: hypothetical protein ACOYJV_09735 [Aminivibrio sp.]
MKKIKVILWGLGTMGTLMAKIIGEKEGLEIAGALDSDPEKGGKPLGALTGCPKHEQITVSSDSAGILPKRCRCGAAGPILLCERDLRAY